MEWDKQMKKELLALHKETFCNVETESGAIDAAKRLKKRLKSRINGDMTLLLMYKELCQVDSPMPYVTFVYSLLPTVLSLLMAIREHSVSGNGRGLENAVFICGIMAIFWILTGFLIVCCVRLYRGMSHYLQSKFILSLLEEIEKELIFQENNINTNQKEGEKDETV